MTACVVIIINKLFSEIFRFGIKTVVVEITISYYNL